MKYTEADREVQEFRLEKDFQKYVVSRLRHIPNMCLFNIHGGQFNVGIPDLLGCYDGKFFAIELKIKKGKPTPLQLQRLTDIRHAGGIQGVAKNWGEVKYILETGGIKLDYV